MPAEGRYRPGAWAGVTTPNGWLLVDLPVTDDRIAQSWSALRDGHGTDRTLDALLRDGLAELPGFALAAVEAGLLRIVVRRDATVLVRVGDEERVISGPAGSWQDLELPLPVDHLQLRVASEVDDDPAAAGVPIGLGIAQACRIDLVSVDVRSPEDASASAPLVIAKPEPQVEPQPEPESEPELDPEPVAQDYSDLFAGTEDRDAFIARLTTEQDAAAESAVDSADDAPEVTPGTSPARTEVSSSHTAIWTGDLDPQQASPQPEQLAPPPSPLTAAHPEDSAPSAPAPGALGIIDGVPWLSGNSAAPPPPVPLPPPSGSAPPPVPPAPPAPPVPSAPPAPSTAPVPGLPSPAITMQPPLASPAPPASPTAAAHPPGTDPGEDPAAELTMSRAELLAAMGHHDVVGPSVLAIWCSNGHPTPPAQEHCRQCGAAVTASHAPSEIPRPPLGTLRSAGGEGVVLDRDIVLGRAPQASASRAANQPHLVKVADPGISRNHLHVALDGWQVLVRDLGSANGTEIQLPGREIEKLRANEDYLLEAGTVLILAEDVRYTFEISS